MLCCSSKNVISDQINKEEKDDSLTTEAVDCARVRVPKTLPRQAVRL